MTEMSGDHPFSSQSQSQPPPQTEHDFEAEDTLVDDLPTTSKFGFAWPTDPYNVQRLKTPERPSRRLSSSAAVTVSPTEETLASIAGPPAGDRSSTTPTSHAETPLLTGAPLSRTFSMPLPSQLFHLQNPCRTASSPPEPSLESDEDISQLRELSVELADSVQMVVQTLLQVSPPQVLNSTKEQFSACSVLFPTSAMSAMFTSMKSLNYMSANMSAFCTAALRAQILGEEKLNAPFGTPCHEPTDFDIGDLLQSIGDALSGAAAQAGVDIILYHGDVALKHVTVRGDESGITYALSHIVRQFIGVASRGDAIEIGLFVTPKSSDEVSSDDVKTSSSLESGEQFQCTFDIFHKFATPECTSGDTTQDSPSPTRPPPAIHSLLLRRLLSHLGASLTSHGSPKLFAAGHVCELTLKLDRGSQSLVAPLSTHSPDATPGGPTSDLGIADEPTLEKISQFVETLRGNKATLFASAKGSFAHHLTSYLTAWGLDVSHASGEADVDESATQVEPSEIVSAGMEIPATGRSSLGVGTDVPVASGVLSTTAEDLPSLTKPISFILIDDDVDVLRERLRTFHAEQTNLNQANVRKHTSSAIYRARTSPQITRGTGQTQVPQSSVVVIHFTSLANYKTVKDVVQSDLSSYPGTQASIPEIMIIPKPTGPRRVLTALYTAVTKPAMDPFFVPIATSPSSPNIHRKPSFNLHNAASVSPTNRPAGSRANSERSTRSGTGDYPMPIPSPLGLSDAKDYFAEGSAKLGTSPSSGLVIQSPGGQPAGIFFHPKSKASWNPPASLSMERDVGQLAILPERRIPRTAFETKSPGKLSSTPSVSDTQEPQPTPTHEFSMPAFVQKEKMQGLEEHPSSRSPQPSSSPSAFRTLSVSETTSRRALSPPTSPRRERSTTPAAIQRRTIPKRSSSEKRSNPYLGTPKQWKGHGDANIVPPISVLIVDDNPINQTILSTFMKKKRIKYDVAKNGQEAVQKWRTGGFHLILMDIQMPVMDGIQATKEIRRAEKENALAGYPPSNTQGEQDLLQPGSGTQELRSLTSPYRSSVIIVALTASSLQSDRVAALAAGCNDFLTKPVSLLWLNNKIIEWGSIKALQMWADVRSDAIKSISSGQASSQARNVAERLHMPQGRTTPSPSRASTNSNIAQPSAVPPIASVPHIALIGPAATASVPFRSCTPNSTTVSNQPPLPVDMDPRTRSSSSDQTSESQDFDAADSEGKLPHDSDGGALAEDRAGNVTPQNRQMETVVDNALF